MKAMIFLRRRQDLSREQFRDWWLKKHRPLAEALPGLKRHTFNWLDGDLYDAVVEQWFDNREAMMTAYDSDAGRAVVADSQAHVSWRKRALVEEFPFEVDAGARA